jgi:hypothetical protein
VIKRNLRADVMLVHNIRALLDSRGIEDKALAIWCGHRPPWLSKILSGERGIPIKELGKVADFFALTVSDLFQFGISSMTDRRRRERRQAIDRRTGRDRRVQRGQIHPDVPLRFRSRQPPRLTDGSDQGDPA